MVARLGSARCKLNSGALQVRSRAARTADSTHRACRMQTPQQRRPDSVPHTTQRCDTNPVAPRELRSRLRAGPPGPGPPPFGTPAPAGPLPAIKPCGRPDPSWPAAMAALRFGPPPAELPAVPPSCPPGRWLCGTVGGSGGGPGAAPAPLAAPPPAAEGAPSAQRRKRTSFTAAQLETLELVFQDTMYPDIYLRERLADATQIPESRIQVRGGGCPPSSPPALAAPSRPPSLPRSGSRTAAPSLAGSGGRPGRVPPPRRPSARRAARPQCSAPRRSAESGRPAPPARPAQCRVRTRGAEAPRQGPTRPAPRSPSRPAVASRSREWSGRRTPSAPSEPSDGRPALPCPRLLHFIPEGLRLFMTGRWGRLRRLPAPCYIVYSFYLTFLSHQADRMHCSREDGGGEGTAVTF